MGAVVNSDGRVPVVLGRLEDLRPGDVLVIEAAGAWATREFVQPVVRLASAHAAGCACCAGRDPWAEALGGLFVARMRGEAARFERVLAVLEAAAGARFAAILEEDRLLAARYRLS